MYTLKRNPISGRKFIYILLIFTIIFLVRCAFRVFPEFTVVHQFQNNFHDMPCSLPKINPFDQSISDFFWVPDPLQCASDNSAVVYVDENNRVRYNETVLKLLTDIRKSDINCLFRSVRRGIDDDSVEFVDLNVIIGSNDTLPEDFTHVHCKTQTGKLVYDNILTGIKRTLNNKKETTKSKFKDESSEHLSVYLFGLDSVSRGASFRYLPKTREFLTKNGAYDFEGLMKVGDNTLPNLIPLLTGINLSKMPGYENKTFDGYPFIWKNFSSNGYVTMFAEDMPHIAAFNNKLKGFRSQPTDHYMRPFTLGLNELDHTKYKLQNVYRFLEDKGLKVRGNSVFCNHENKNHMDLINYFKKFLLQYRHQRKFSFTFLTELAHTFINFLHYGDEDFVEFFSWMKHEGFFNNSVLIVFSDHGSRFNGLRNTYIGRVEARMPMLYILLPNRMKTKYPKVHRNLAQNTQRLITHYDIYQTLLDLAVGNLLNPSTRLIKESVRAVSIFGEIPETRSCADAGIPVDYCACYKSSPVNISENIKIKDIADAVVTYINSLLEQEKSCQVLSLHRIISAAQLTLGLQYKQTSWVENLFRPEGNRVSYTVLLETVPGFATFEASCEIDSSGSLFVQPNIGRTNVYGNQSRCVGNRDLRQFCFC